jgi:hypothetical protein
MTRKQSDPAARRNKGGRPKLYGDDEVLAALAANGGLVYAAARRLGCNPQTIYNRARREPSVRRVIREQRGLLVDAAQAGLWDKINEGNLTAIIYTLSTLGRKRGFCKRVESRVAGVRNAPPVQTSPGYTPEQLAALNLLPKEVVEQIYDALKQAEQMHQPGGSGRP